MEHKQGDIDIIQQSIDKTVQMLKQRGYSGQFRTYDDGQVRKDGELKTLLHSMLKSGRPAMELSFRGLDPVIVNQRPYFYSFHMSYKPWEGVSVKSMEVDREGMMLRKTLPVHNEKDIPFKNNLKQIVALKLPEKKPTKFRVNGNRGRKMR